MHSENRWLAALRHLDSLVAVDEALAYEFSRKIVNRPGSVTDAHGVENKADVADTIGSIHVHESQGVLGSEQLGHKLTEREHE